MSDKYTWEDFESDMEQLAEDRQRLLERLGMSEHEWACAGGLRLPPFVRFSEMEDTDD